MITGLLPKLGMGVLGLGTVTASGYGVYELARTKSISEILGREHKVLKTGDGDDKGDWTKIVDKYKKAPEFSSQKTTDPKKINGLTASASTIEEKDLKSKCSELLKKPFVKAEDQDYIDAKNWCTDNQIKQQ